MTIEEAASDLSETLVSTDWVWAVGVGKVGSDRRDAIYIYGNMKNWQAKRFNLKEYSGFPIVKRQSGRPRMNS